MAIAPPGAAQRWQE